MDKNDESVVFEEFCESARPALERELQTLLRNSIDRISSIEATWHPNGFAVFHLEENHELGRLRLHIWPDTSRIMRPDDAPIHTHVWHLCSHILAGTYSETLYEEVENGSSGAEEYHSVDIEYLVDRNSFNAPAKAFLRPDSTTHDSVGEFHSVPAEVPHETHIEEGKFVATLLLTSLPVSQRATMYSAEEIQVGTYERPTVTKEQKIELLGRLQEEIKGQRKQS